MAKILSKSGIATGDTIEPGHVTQSIDAFTGVDAYDLTLSGSLDITGSLNMPTGSILEGTASLSNFSISSSHAITASYALFSEGGGGGGGNPQGPDTSVQFRNSSNFAGNGNFTYDTGTNLLTSLSSSLGFITSSFILASTISASTIQAGAFVGNISADEIRTPALINGVASTLENASSSITPLGFARFVSASIGGWDISTDAIESNSMIMRPIGILQTKNFASGVSGWKISAEGNGTAEFENAVIRGTLRTTTFEKESVNAVGGQLWIANSTTISASSVAASATTMSVANASGYVAGEILMAKKIDNTGFTTEYILVNSSSVDGDGSNTDSTFGRLMVTRGYDSGSTGDFVGGVSGISQSYTDGQVLVSTGKSGSGYIKLNASPNDTATPFMDITERTGSGVYDVLLKARLGDLSGLANSDMVFNKPNPGFGLATDNVFLQGGIKATFGEIGGFNITNSLISSSNQNLILKSSGQITASDGFLFGNKATSNYVAYEGGTLTVRGDLTVDNIKTPATIAGSPSTEANASASINALGFARFTSASIAGFTVNTEEIKSSDNSLRLKADGNITASKVLLGDKASSQYLQYDGSTLTVRGDLSVDQISTPAALPEAAASSSIRADGFARFVSASIGGFEIADNQIRSGFTPASSSIDTINTNVSMSFSVPNTTTGGSNSTTVSTITTNSTSDAIFNNAYIKADSANGDEFGFGGGNQTIGRISSINTSTGALTLASGYTWGTYYNEGPITKTFSLYKDSGATTRTFASSSTHTVNFPATESITIDSTNNRLAIIDGEITASRGIIGGTEITSTTLQSANDISPEPDAGSNGRAFKLENNGTISGSALYIREVIGITGSNVVYPLFDSEQGLVDGKNVGRNLVSNYVEYVRSNADDGVTAPLIVNQHFLQLMPYETTILVNAQAATINGAEVGAVTGLVQFVAEKLENSGSFDSGIYTNQFDNWVAVDTAQFSVAAANESPWTGSYLATYDQGVTLDIPEASQASPIRISVKMGVNPAGGAGTSALNKTILKGYTLTATRALSVASAGNSGTEMPQK